MYCIFVCFLEQYISENCDIDTLKNHCRPTAALLIGKNIPLSFTAERFSFLSLIFLREKCLADDESEHG